MRREEAIFIVKDALATRATLRDGKLVTLYSARGPSDRIVNSFSKRRTTPFYHRQREPFGWKQKYPIASLAEYAKIGGMEFQRNRSWTRRVWETIDTQNYIICELS
jgi:hypothetical protein